MDATTEALWDRAQPVLGQALAEHILAREGEDPDDREHRKYILYDINAVLLSAGPGAEVWPSMLSDPDRLASHLRASMGIPAQVLAKELPKRLTTWLDQEPPRTRPDRVEWVEEGRFLLDQANLSGGCD